MKKFIYIITLCITPILIAGCLYKTNATTNTEMSLGLKDKNENEEIPAVITSGKEKIDTATLKEKALYQFEATDGKTGYNIFLFSEDAEGSLYEGEDQSLANKGDLFFNGHYSIYLAEKGTPFAYKQSVLEGMGKLTFNLAAKQVYPLSIGNKTLIAIIQQSELEHSTIQFLSIKDGEIQRVQSQQEILSMSGTKIKAINQKFLQTAYYNSGFDQLVISTWTFNEETLELSLHDQTEINQNMKIKHWLNIWTTKEEYFFPYVNVKLNRDLLEKGKLGIPIGSPYPIGTNISEIKKTDPYFIDHGIEDGVSFLMYPEITYYFDGGTGIVTAVAIPGERIKTTLEQVKHTFGEPNRIEQNENGEELVVYLVDKYTIEIVADADGKVIVSYLRKN